MGRQLFPKEFISLTVESYTFEISKQSRAIYAIFLGALIVVAVLLPIVKLKVSKSLSGQLTSSESKVQISSPLSGRVNGNHLRENVYVNRGDTLLTFDKKTVLSAINRYEVEREKLLTYVSDLDRLIEGNQVVLASHRYQLIYDEYQSSIEKLDVIYRNAERNFERQKKLFESEVISSQDFDEHEFVYQQAIAERKFFEESSRAQWKVELLNYQEELDELGNQLIEYQEEVRLRYVLAPVSGTLQNVEFSEIGQFLHTGTKIAEISPGDSVVVTCLVSPADVGLLRVGQKSSFRIDAFNYNEWGMIDGAIYEISDDVYVQNNVPYFRVKCTLNKNYLSLSNGFKGYLKKGMTLQANFELAERTLYQLLYDKVDDWVNPKSATIDPVGIE